MKGRWLQAKWLYLADLCCYNASTVVDQRFCKRVFTFGSINDDCVSMQEVGGSGDKPILKKQMLSDHFRDSFWTVDLLASQKYTGVSSQQWNNSHHSNGWWCSLGLGWQAGTMYACAFSGSYRNFTSHFTLLCTQHWGNVKFLKHADVKWKSKENLYTIFSC